MTCPRCLQGQHVRCRRPCECNICLRRCDPITRPQSPRAKRRTSTASGGAYSWTTQAGYSRPANWKAPGPRRGSASSATRAQIHEAKLMAEAGCTIADIARTLGRHRHTVRKMLGQAPRGVAYVPEILSASSDAA